jgi:hypothetical protein
VDEVDAEMEEVEEVEDVEDVADENCENLYKGFAKKVDKMPFDQFKSNTSSSKTPESKTARSLPSRMDMVLDPTNVKETKSAATTKGRVFPTVTRLSGESTTPKINKNAFLMKPASQISQVRNSPSQIHIGQVRNA